MNARNFTGLCCAGTHAQSNLIDTRMRSTHSDNVIEPFIYTFVSFEFESDSDLLRTEFGLHI